MPILINMLPKAAVSSKRINELLAQDPLFTPTDSKVGYIKEIILK